MSRLCLANLVNVLFRSEHSAEIHTLTVLSLLNCVIFTNLKLHPSTGSVLVTWVFKSVERGLIGTGYFKTPWSIPDLLNWVTLVWDWLGNVSISCISYRWICVHSSSVSFLVGLSLRTTFTWSVYSLTVVDFLFLGRLSHHLWGTLSGRSCRGGYAQCSGRTLTYNTFSVLSGSLLIPFPHGWPWRFYHLRDTQQLCLSIQFRYLLLLIFQRIIHAASRNGCFWEVYVDLWHGWFC